MSRPYKFDLFVGAARITSRPCCSICRGGWCLGTRTRHCRGGSITSRPYKKNRTVAKNHFLRSGLINLIYTTGACDLHRAHNRWHMHRCNNSKLITTTRPNHIINIFFFLPPLYFLQLINNVFPRCNRLVDSLCDRFYLRRQKIETR